MKFASNRSGFSLVEVVVSLALMATLVATALLAHGRATRQASLASSKLRAVAAADRLLAQWVLYEGFGVIAQQKGLCGEQEEFEWKTGEKIQVQDSIGKVKLEIFDPRLESSTAVVAVWVAVDFQVEN